MDVSRELIALEFIREKFYNANKIDNVQLII